MSRVQDNKHRAPLVSICCLAYNQEKYIRQTLESLLMQRTSFSYEIIVHDDASTDNTRKIIEEYASNFPHTIKPVFQKENKYSKSGFNFQYKYVFPKAIGKYIAICDGDDYWIDPLKLQKQVDFLESHPDYGLVHTKAAKYYEASETFAGTAGHNFDDFEGLLTECSVAHSSTCFRNDLMIEYIENIKPQERTTWTTDDFPLWLWIIQHSKFKLLDEVTTIYRQQIGSLSHIKNDSKRLDFNEGVYDIVDFYLSKYATPEIKKEKIRARYYSDMINLYFLNQQWCGVRESVRIFYKAEDWLNLLWIAITLPFSFSEFMIKGSYRVRSVLFNFFNIYPVRK